MTYFVNTRNLLCSGFPESLWLDDEKKLILFSRGGLLFAFNLHPTWSQETVFIPTRTTGLGGYKVVLSTDDGPFGGQNRIDMDRVYYATETEFGAGIKIYLPCRTGIALQKVTFNA